MHKVIIEKTEKPKKPDPVDIHVGQRVRARRKLLSMSQTALGNQIGITFQQIQKYERGTNRMGSSRLFRIAIALDVPVAWFFEDAETKLPGYAVDVLDDDIWEKPETQELIDAYYRIKDPKERKRVASIVKLLSKK